jgi:phosphoenolpyruvate-protein phosphotransferase (PTS system enzyme I)
LDEDDPPPPTAQPRATAEATLQGIGVSLGVAFGQVHLLDRRQRRYPRHRITQQQIPGELLRLQTAQGDARTALLALAERAGEHKAILEAHLLMVDDPLLVDGARKQVQNELKCAEWALKSCVTEIRAHFDALGDPYFRERRSDVDFVGDRMLDALLRQSGQSGPFAIPLSNPDDGLPADCVVVAHELSPADAIAFSRRGVRAFVTEVGGQTSHTAILARALGIPAVAACPGLLQQAGQGDPVVVDGQRGRVVLRPEEKARAHFVAIAAKQARVQELLQQEADAPTTTTDGVTVTLLANIEIPEEIPAALAAGAVGVGLYRSEFLFLNRSDIPDAAEHAEAAAEILRALGDRPAVLRTFDLGSDKMSAAIRVPREQNPALGLRGVRLGFKREDAMRAQLRGMARALSLARRGSILLPMIGSVEDVLLARRWLREEQEALAKEGVDVWWELQVGVMIELPAAVWVADHLAEVADFFSVGTNDLIQYLLAIDRGNEHVAHLYDPLHPGVLRALQHVVAAGHKQGIPVGLCGESAADPRLTPLLLGLGFDSLSMPMTALRPVKHVLRRFAMTEARELFAACAAQKTAAAAHALLDEAIARHPDLAPVLD